MMEWLKIFEYATSRDILFLSLYGLYAVVALNVARIMRRRQSPAATLAWILFHIVLPFIAVPLYFLLGENRIKRFGLRRKVRSIEFSSILNNLLPTVKKKAGIPVDQGLSFYQKQSFKEIFERFGDVFQIYPNRVRLLIDGDTTFSEIFHAIEKSQSYILVQYYILRSDRLGVALQKLLIKKASEGVKVYLLYDDMGSFFLSRRYVKALKQAGVHVARFLPVTSFSRLFQINFRNHRKLVVIDGICAFTGGLNVGEEYYGKGTPDRYWRDTHVRVIGPAAKQLEEVFLDDWYFAAKKNLKLTPSKEISNCDFNFEKMKEFDANKDRDHLAYTQVIPSGPTDLEQIALLMFMNAINEAKHRLWIATPYFIPDQTLLNALVLAKMRGVDVHVILPQKSDNRLVHWVGLSYAEDIERRGIKFSLYQAGMMHSKVVLVDDDLCLVGTCNFDNRALFLNFESTLVIQSKSFALTVESMFLDDFTVSRRMHVEEDPPWYSPKSVITDLGRLLAPLL